MKKLLKGGALLLLIAIALMTLSSCGLLMKPAEQEIKDALERLLPRAYEAAYIVYGPGIDVDENYAVDPDWTTAHYVEVDPRYKYQTEQEIRDLILSAHTKSYAAQMAEYAFEGSEDLMARYNEYEGKLRMDVTKEPLNIVDEIYTEELRVLKGTAYACEVEVGYSMDEGKTVERMVIQMAKEGDRWLLDGPTY